jgi:hypothetical protein
VDSQRKKQIIGAGRSNFTLTESKKKVEPRNVVHDAVSKEKAKNLNLYQRTQCLREKMKNKSRHH